MKETFTLHRNRETKNTFTYTASNGGYPLIYIGKIMLPNPPPKVLTVTVESVDA